MQPSAACRFATRTDMARRPPSGTQSKPRMALASNDAYAAFIKPMAALAMTYSAESADGWRWTSMGG